MKAAVFHHPHKITLDEIIRHRLPLSDVSKAYDIFRNREDDGVKVVLQP
ncbi:MAG: hypothetical protein V4507_05865 [Verrucomicrobiota bacterium]